MKKVLIYGVYDWNNLGDDLMMYAISNKLQSSKCLEPYFIKSHGDNYFDFDREYDLNLFLDCRFENVFLNKIFQFFNLLTFSLKKNDYDALIFMGGGYINRITGSGYGKLIYIFLLKTAFKLKKKKVFFTGQTVGPIKNSLDVFLIKKIYKDCKVVVRETYSKEFLDFLKVNCELVGDDAFLLNEASEVSCSKKEKYVIVNYKLFTGYENLVPEFAEVIKKIYFEHNLLIKLLPFRNDNYEEFNYHKELFEILKKSNIKVELCQTTSVQEVLDIFKNCEFVLATAYHAVVLGLMHNKRVYCGYIGEYYKTKIKGISQFYNEDRCRIYDFKDKEAFKKLLSDVSCKKSVDLSKEETTKKIKKEVNTEWDKIIGDILDEKGK